jgi:hypothetical protein
VDAVAGKPRRYRLLISRPGRIGYRTVRSGSTHATPPAMIAPMALAIAYGLPIVLAQSGTFPAGVAATGTMGPTNPTAVRSDVSPSLLYVLRQAIGCGEHAHQPVLRRTSADHQLD